MQHDVMEDDLLCKKCIRFIALEDRPHCLFVRSKNKLEINTIFDELNLGFMEQRAISLSHVRMSIILVLSRQVALQGQVVHFHVGTDVVVEQILPFPCCYEFLAVLQEKPMKND